MNTTKQLADALRDAQRAQPVYVTTMDVDRVLGMSDQFLEDWRESVDDDTARDSELEEREQDWPFIRALILHRVNAHDALVSALQGCVERLGIVIESDTDDALHGASPDDVAAYEAGRAALANVGGAK